MRTPTRLRWVRWALTVSLVGLLSLGVASRAWGDSSTQGGPSGYTPGPILARFLEGPMSELDEIVFAVRVPGRDHWYVTFGNYADHSESPARPYVVG